MSVNSYPSTTKSTPPAGYLPAQIEGNITGTNNVRSINLQGNGFRFIQNYPTTNYLTSGTTLTNTSPAVMTDNSSFANTFLPNANTYAVPYTTSSTNIHVLPGAGTATTVTCTGISNTLLPYAVISNGGNTLVAFVSNFSVGALSRSTDGGATWASTNPGANDWRYGSYDSTLGFVLCSSGGNFVSSTDGSAWTSRNGTNLTTLGAVAGNGIVVTILSASQSPQYTSSTAGNWTWTQVNNVFAVAMNNLRFFNGTFVAWSTTNNSFNTNFYTTTNGATWTARSFGTSPVYYNEIFGVNGYWMGSNSTTGTYYSNASADFSSGWVGTSVSIRSTNPISAIVNGVAVKFISNNTLSYISLYGTLDIQNTSFAVYNIGYTPCAAYVPSNNTLVFPTYNAQASVQILPAGTANISIYTPPTGNA